VAWFGVGGVGRVWLGRVDVSGEVVIVLLELGERARAFVRLRNRSHDTVG